MSGTLLLSIVIPAFNEEDRLPSTLRAIEEWAGGWDGGAIEVIVVDDGSSDATAAAAERWAAEAARMVSARVLRAAHRGKGAAVALGMEAATGAVRLFMDADLAVPLRHVRDMVEALREGADVAIGSRELAGASRSGEPAYRHWMGRVFNWLVAGLAVRGISDTQCGFKAFRADAGEMIFDRVRLYHTDSNVVSGSRVTAFDVELLAIAQRLGMGIVQVPVEWKHVAGTQVRPWSDALAMLWDTLRVRRNLRLGRYD